MLLRVVRARRARATILHRRCSSRVAPLAWPIDVKYIGNAVRLLDGSLLQVQLAEQAPVMLELRVLPNEHPLNGQRGVFAIDNIACVYHSTCMLYKRLTYST
jgi:hypothetical protein